MKDLLGSHVKFRDAGICDVKFEMFRREPFDQVFLGALLCNMRDPIGALLAARRVCRNRVMASTPVVIGETGPDILPRQYLPDKEIDQIGWWLPNEACFRHWFLAAGFSKVDVSRKVKLRSDLVRTENRTAANEDQIRRAGSGLLR